MRYQYKLTLVSLGAWLAVTAQAAVTLDGSLGRAGALPGPNYQITADWGQQHGGNLFHSFGVFSINTGESATFSGPGSVRNIIGRVTGGQVSFIDGAIRSTIPGANLYLLNPAGVLFGEHAALDVPGSVHISTADYLRLSDGGRFDARTPGNSVLTVAPVAAFGFLSETPGKIEVNGGFLRVPESQTLSLIGGDITLTNATLYAPAGRINLASVGSAGEVIPSDTDLAMQGFGTLGTLTLTHTGDPRQWNDLVIGDVDTSGEGGGAIFIRGGQWINKGGWVFADTYGARTGHGADIVIAGDVLFDRHAELTSETYGAGTGGSVNLTANTLTLLSGSYISANTWGAGNAGSVSVNVGNLLVDEQDSAHFTGIASSAQPGSTGAGGDITLAVANTFNLLNGSQIFAGTYGPGNAGSITLTIADTLAVLNGSVILTVTFGAGNAGNVTITARNLLVDRQGSPYFTGIASSTTPDSTGAGADMTLTVTDTLTLLNGGQILVGTQGAGNAGSLLVNAGRAVTIAGGFEGNGVVDGEGFFPSGLFVGAQSTGQAGNLTLTTPTLTIADGGRISATSNQTAGGNLFINADHLRLFNGGVISTSVYGDSNTPGGNVTINSTNMVALNGSSVTAQATQGLGGNILVNADVFLHDAADITDVLNASSQVEGNDGTVQNNAPTSDISGSLTVLPANYLDAAGQLSRRCGASDPDTRSRFTVQGRGGLPATPDAPIPTRVTGCRSESPTLVSAASHASRLAAQSENLAAGFGNQ